MAATSLWRDLHGQWPAILLLALPAFLPIGIAADAPLAIGAICGAAIAWRKRATLRADFAVRLVVMLFACHWLAALISAPAAVAPEKTWDTVARLLCFLPFALFVPLALRDPTQWPRIDSAVATIVVLWLLDAWVQIFTGFSIAGPMEKERLSGIFGAGNLKLGPVLAVLSPFVLKMARERFGTRGLIIAALFMLMPILLAGSRAAWLMFALVIAVFVWRQTRSPLRFVAWSCSALLVAGGAAWIADRDSPQFDARVQRTLQALNGSEQAIDFAGAGRVRIWHASARMIAAHPLTGVGVRGFRYAYPAFADPGDDFVNAKTDEGAFHAHQLVLEVLSETGAIGLLLWLIGALLAIRAWRRADAQARERAFAPGLALVAMCFPLNTHFAFYSSWWGLFFWWLLALFIGALTADRADGA